MRKFSFLLLAYLITYLGLRLIAGDALGAGYVLRDGLLLGLIGAAIFALNAGPLHRAHGPAVRHGWPSMGRALWAAGAVAGLTAAALMLTAAGGPALHALRLTLWLLGLGLMLAGAAWRGPVLTYAPPTHRWDVDEHGDFIRTPVSEDADAETPADPRFPAIGRGVLWTSLLIIVLAGAFFRFWRLGDLPGGCVGAECELGLRLMQGTTPLMEGAPASPYGWLAQVFFGITDQGLLALRLAAAVIGTLTIPIFYLAAAQAGGSMAGILATALLALSPWHIVASRGAQPWIALPLLLSLGAWTLLRGVHGMERDWAGRGWWALAGVSLGAAGLVAPPLLYALWLWLAAGMLALLIYGRRDLRAAALPLSMLAVGALATSLPALAFQGDAPALAGLDDGFLRLITGLLAGGGRAGPVLLAAGVAALVFDGGGALVRRLRRPMAGVLLLAALILGGGAALLDPETTQPAALTLALAVPLLLLATVALDQLAGSFAYAWRRLISPAALLAALLGIILLLAGGRALKTTRTLERLAGADDPALSAMADYLARTFDAGDDQSIPENMRIFAPPALFDAPSARLRAGALLASPRLQPLADLEDTLQATAAGIDIQMLLSGDDQALLTLLADFYPGGQREPVYDEEGTFLFTHFTADAGAASFQPGLVGTVYAGIDFADPAGERRDGPLVMDWAASSDQPRPFSVLWRGSLLTPASGRYTFAVEGADQPGVSFSLWLGDRIILDSSLGEYEHSELLPRGHDELTMRYASETGSPPPLTVRWTRPDGTTEPIPRAALVSPPLPDLGLLAEYYANDQFAGPVLTLRKEMLIGTPAPVEGAVAVRWRGKLAASRAGEYLLSMVADGRRQLVIDGRTLIDSDLAGPGESALSDYNEALIYLTKGWHDLEVRFVPAGPDSQLRLLWQPPGGDPALLPATYLTPVQSAVTAVDASLPSPPPLVDEQLGDDEFALSRLASQRQPQQVAPPDGLTPLPAVLEWQTNTGCGDDPSQLARPHGAAMDLTAGRIYVADTANRRIVAYDMAGQVQAVIADERLREVSDIGLAPDRGLLALDGDQGQLWRVDPEMQTVEPASAATSFYHPRGLDVDGLGMMAVADTGGARVVVMEPGGGMVAQFGGQETPFGRGQPVDALLGNALWSITAEDGRLWNLYVDAGFTAVGKAVTMDGPRLAGLDDGSFFLTDPARRTLFYHRPSGQPVAQFAYPDVFELPTGVAAARDGDAIRLAVVDTARCTLSLWRVPVDALGE